MAHACLQGDRNYAFDHWGNTSGGAAAVPTCTAILGRVVYGMQRILYTLRGILTDEF